MSETPQQDALAVLRQLREAGFEAYFAGGCVRDLLLGQQPKDFDVATSAPPPQVRGLFKNTQAVGAAFGVILVRQGKSTIEVATFRTDLEYRDGRRPEGIKFATAQEDAQRRDFTINGLFLDPIENKIIDYVGGQEDLKAQLVRAIGDPNQRFSEDYLRLLRAVRFASRLDFKIETGTLTAIRARAHQIAQISPERIAEELRKMLMPTSRHRAFALLNHPTHLLECVMRFTGSPSPHSTGLFNAVDPSNPISFGLALAAIVLDYQVPANQPFDAKRWLSNSEIKRVVNAMRKTLKISNDESAELAGSMSFLQLVETEKPSLAVMKRFLQQPHSQDALHLMTAMAVVGLISNQLLQPLADLMKTNYGPLPLITGDDLTAAGAMPGPAFKAALDAAYDAQLEGTIDSREQAMQIATKVLNEPRTK